MKRLALFGSTGSIGRQTLDVVRWHPDQFSVVALVARQASHLFRQQITEFTPAIACLTEGTLSGDELPPGTRFIQGESSLDEIATDNNVDMLVVASSGTVAFRPTLAALGAGKPVALANKETLIMAGHLVIEAATRGAANLLPIDSEHSAIWQCLRGEEPYAERVRRLILTASGGALRDLPAEELANVTPEQALRHPTWNMGPKVTIDSASLMNKGLEVIEAHWLFGLPYDRVDVLIHHQSVVHSLVEFVDGSIKAQLGPPDMRLPIQYALGYPARLPIPEAGFDLASVGQLSFARVDAQRYPCLALAYEAGRKGGTYPTVLNAANEVAVRRFLDESLRFGDIPSLIEDTLAAHAGTTSPALEQVLESDRWARAYANGWTHS